MDPSTGGVTIPRVEARRDLPPAGRPSPRVLLWAAAIGFLSVVLLAVWFWFWPTAEAIERRWREQAGFDPLAALPLAIRVRR